MLLLMMVYALGALHAGPLKPETLGHSAIQAPKHTMTKPLLPL